MSSIRPSATRLRARTRPSGPRPTFDRPGLRLSAIAGCLVVVGAGIFCCQHSAIEAYAAGNEPAKPAPKEAVGAHVYRQTIQPLLRKYCVECHGNETPNGGINFESLTDYSGAVSVPKTWHKVKKMLETGAMPPADHPSRPKEAEIAAVIRWIDQSVFEDASNKVHDPGHVTIRRLNRAEYNNTIRDLVGVSLHAADEFPSDDVGNGFDNQGDVLSISPLLMERYLAAAERISSVALFGIDLKNPPINRLDVGKMSPEGSAQLVRKKYAREKRIWLPSVGSVRGSFNCPTSGEYVVRIIAEASQTGDEFPRLEIQVDKKSRQTFDITGQGVLGHYELRLHLSQGPHSFVASYRNVPTEPPAPPPLAHVEESGTAKKIERVRVAREIEIDHCELEGPFAIDPGEPALAKIASRKRILFCTPGTDGSAEQCANRILSRFAMRAFRRPVGVREIKPYVDLALASSPDGPLDRVVQTGLTAILVSPHFLFRIEEPGNSSEGKDSVPIGAFELASRLSYFLWSSMPDDELFRHAADGSLVRRDVLTAQVRRMLKDPKSQALVTNFAAQWLNLGLLDLTRPSPRVFEAFDSDLRKDMRRETELFFTTLVRDDRHVLDLLNGKYTFLNDRLARLYDVKGVEGEKFREVSLQGSSRAGVLTQASILTLTSERTRTSPVKRGKWILETFLGEAPPPPPANVPELAKTQKANPKASLREQLALHRKSASCAICHKIMDPLGLGLENFDGIGRWREKEKDHTIDASGSLPGGESFRGPLELIGVLTKRQDAFRRHFAETLLAYALGRGVEYYDRCAVDLIVADTRRGDDRFSALVTGIVTSDPFLLRRGGGNRNER